MTLTATTAFVPNDSTVIDGETVGRRVNLPYVGRHQAASTMEKIDIALANASDIVGSLIQKSSVAGRNLLRKAGQFLKNSPARVSHKIHDTLSARLTARRERYSAETCMCDFSPAAFQKKINDSMERVRAAQAALSRERIIARTPTVATSRMAYATAA